VTVRYLCIPKKLQAIQSSSGNFSSVGFGISVPVLTKNEGRKWIMRVCTQIWRCPCSAHLGCLLGLTHWSSNGLCCSYIWGNPASYSPGLRSIRAVNEEGEKGYKEHGELEAPLISASLSQVCFTPGIVFSMGN